MQCVSALKAASLLLERQNSTQSNETDIDDFQDETGEEYEASSFGGFGDYMRRKKMKLQNLDAEIRATSGDCPQIFRGIVAHVNGYTQPSLQDLHRLIVSHGGGFLQYLDGKTAATHIIASSLTPKKCEEFRRYRIVKPAWVTESIKEGRLLPWNDFRVVDEGQSQKVLKFGGGRMSSQASTPRSGYKDQSSTSWYNNQLQAAALTTNERGARDQTTPSKRTPATPTLPLGSPRSSRRYSSDSPTAAQNSKPDLPTEPPSDQSQPLSTPSKNVPQAPDEDPDELESPLKDGTARIQVDPVLSNSAHKTLNLSGSQFIMPALPEPKESKESKAAPAAAPMGDIRSKLAAQSKSQSDPRSESPCPASRETKVASSEQESSGVGIPPHSELDPEILAALPEDIRKEVLAQYGRSSVQTGATSSTAPPSSTPARPPPSQSAGTKRSASPLKKTSRPSKSATGSTRTLMQLGFVSKQPAGSASTIKSTPGQSSTAAAATQAQPPISEPVSSDVKLQPEGTQTENETAKNNSESNNTGSSALPVFTSQGLSNIDDLRNAISAWHSAFTADGPYSDDVEALCVYLRRVTTEEKDVEKAVSVVRWLMWLVDQDSSRPNARSEAKPEDDVVCWSDAIKSMQQSIQSAVETRGLPAVSFE